MTAAISPPRLAKMSLTAAMSLYGIISQSWGTLIGFGVVAERQHAAVIGVLAHDDAPPAGVVHGDREGHQVRLGTGVREANLLDRREAIDDDGGESDLVAVHGAERPAAFEGAAGGGEDRRRAVTEQASGEVTEQVDVANPVDVPQRGDLPPGRRGSGTVRRRATSGCCLRRARSGPRSAHRALSGRRSTNRRRAATIAASRS